MDKITDLISSAICENLPDFVFVKKWRLVKKQPYGWIAIFIEATAWPKSGFYRLECHGNLRVSEIEELYTPFHPYIPVKDRLDHSTLVVNCDKLISDKSLIAGFPNTEKGIEQFSVIYSKALNIDVIPWLEHYSQEENLLRGLLSENPSDCPTSNRLSKFPVVLSILHKRAQWDEFEEQAESFLKYCDQPHATVYRPMATAIIEGLKSQRPTP